MIKVKEGSTSLIDTWNAALAAAAGEGEYDAFKAEENPCNFWSSSEFHAEPTTDGNGKTTYYNGAHRFNLGYNSGNGYSTIKVDWKNRTTVKPYSDLTMYVRPFLAF